MVTSQKTRQNVDPDADLSNGGIYPRGFSSATNWHCPLVKAETLVRLNYGKALLASNRRSGNVPVYGTNGQCGSHDSYLSKGPGVILGRKGQGPLGVEWCESCFWVIDTAYFVSPLTDDLNLKYFYYLVKYIGLNHLKDGTSNPSLSRDTFADLLLPKPTLSEQCAIADILGSLDDKIEVNRKMNETLEAMARAIFKSWFVDFDPVVAKSQRRQPEGLDAETAKLFPDSFEESEIGRIPKGWKVGTINDLATLSRDTITPSQNPNEFFDHYSIPAFDEGRVPKTEMGNTIMSNKFTVHDNCVLLSKLNPRIPRVWMPDSLNNKRALCSTEFLVSIPKANFSKEYLYLLFTSAQFCERFATFVTGTSGSHQRVKPDSLSIIETTLPPEKLVKAFTALVSPLLAMMGSNISQTHELDKIKNALLPNLLSGEVSLNLDLCKGGKK